MGFMVNNLKRPLIVWKRRRDGVRAHPVFSPFFPKFKQRKKETFSATRLTVVHNHASQPLFVHSGFIISHFELSAKILPPPPPQSLSPIMIIQTPSVVEFDFPVSHYSLLHVRTACMCRLFSHVTGYWPHLKTTGLDAQFQ